MPFSQQLIDPTLLMVIMIPLFALFCLGWCLVLSFSGHPSWGNIGYKALFGFTCLFFLTCITIVLISLYNSPHYAEGCFTGGLC